MTRRNIFILCGVGGMFLVSGFLILLGFFPRGSYETEEGNININVSIRENTYGFVDTEFTKIISLNDAGQKYQFEFWSVELKFSLIKRKNNNETFWVTDDYMRGFARVNNGEIDNFSCSDCKGSEELKGEDLIRFTFDQFEWRFVELKSQS